MRKCLDIVPISHITYLNYENLRQWVRGIYIASVRLKGLHAVHFRFIIFCDHHVTVTYQIISIYYISQTVRAL